MTNRNQLITIFTIVFVDLLGFSIILPLIPFYAEDFGASKFVATLLVASYAFAQFIGAPILGNLSDHYGRRPVLLFSIFGTAVGFVIFGLANTLLVLFASRFLDGVTGGNISVAQAYIADISTPENRSRNFGLIGAAFGLGFIVGPVLGGVLSGVGAGLVWSTAIVANWSYALPAFAAALIALANMVAVYFLLPESLGAEERATTATQAPARGFDPAATIEAFRRPKVGPLLNIRFFYALAFAMFTTIYTFFVKERLDFDAQATSYSFGYIGILLSIVQGGLVGQLAKRFTENKLVIASIVLLSVSVTLWAFTPNIVYLLVVLIPIALAAGIFNAIINSLLSGVVSPRELGSILGISASLESLTRVLGPSVGGLLLDYVGTWAPGVFCGVILALLLPYARRHLRITDATA